MDHEQIINQILEIRAIKNACDRAVALKQFEKKYKKTAFYKTTKKPLQLLYYEVLVEDTLTLRTLLQTVKDFIESLDAEKLLQMFDQVNEQTLATLAEGMNDLSTSGILDLLHSAKR